MKLTSLITATCLLLPAVASASVFTVAATNNIYGAGLLSSPAPGGGSGGALPLQIGVTGGGAYQFQYLSGTVSPDYTEYSLDANGIIGVGTDVTSGGHLSDYISANAFSLVGVFLGASGQPVTAPSAINFTSTGVGLNFTSLAPQLGQVFFIGDGSNSSHQTQTFLVPTGATELYLGFADAYNYNAPVGQYEDNIGSVTINVNPVPEPAPMALLVAGSALMAMLRFRNKR